MNIAGYPFDGPYDHNRGFTQSFGCVYALINSSNNLIDVGETSDVNERIPNHDRKACWLRNGCPNHNLYIHKSPDQNYRLNLENAIRQRYSPTCGVR
ncbi:GIY-YIG nuclease family protein [Patescibacteria group bacterium]|nr:GIY-YIG nuclease family protein [Patescibacteria group bacterium]MBU1123338.1 GIY-YIG nuclease family protein [Patescibacteria group bacterium]MBU1911712.1 GIY-YIG nuclease family protein [Patescibacteria group bacterium]